MKFTLLICLLISLTFGFAPIDNQENRDPGFPLLVTTQWLEEHQNDPDLVILHVTQNRREYNKGHIPGARFMWYGWVAMANPELSFELLPVNHLDTLLEGLGISNSSRIVLCGSQGNVSPVARVYITLEYLGMGNRTAVLDGGFDAWKKEGKAVSKEPSMQKRSTFNPQVQPDVFVDAEWMNNNRSKRGISIVDARAPQFYKGTSASYTRDGHIPGAKNIYFTTLFDSVNKMLPQTRLQEIFDSAGVGGSDGVAAYCHVGQTASSVYFAARVLGHKAYLYDGSYEDWNGREEFPFEADPRPDSTKK